MNCHFCDFFWFLLFGCHDICLQSFKYTTLKSLSQFDPESFVDGLLGIGIASGGTSKSEGKALASRLTQMRKERNERAKITAAAAAKKEQQTTLSSTPRADVGGVSALASLDESDTTNFLIDDKMELITPGGGGSISQGKSKTKKKKKGKR